MRKVDDIIEDIETIRKDLLIVCGKKNGLIAFDFAFYANQIADLKSELRLALIEERD